MSKKEHYVLPTSDGDWGIKKSGGEKNIKKFATKNEAISAARKISQNQGSELVIHNKNGKITQKDSHGRDKFPPKG